jgi:hypothetical protein
VRDVCAVCGICGVCLEKKKKKKKKKQKKKKSGNGADRRIVHTTMPTDQCVSFLTLKEARWRIKVFMLCR